MDSKRAGVGLWVTIVLLLTIAGVTYILIPLRHCPWCIGPLPSSGQAPAANGLPIYCPVCHDKCKVSLLRSRAAQSLHPMLAALIRSQRVQTPINPVPTISMMAKAQGRDDGVVFGGQDIASRGSPTGRVRFIQAEGNDYVLALFYGDSLVPELQSRSLVLLDVDGGVRDCFHVFSNSFGSAPFAALPEGNAPEREVATISLLLERAGDPRHDIWCAGRDGRIPKEREPSTVRISEREKAYSIGVSGGRFVFLTRTSAGP